MCNRRQPDIRVQTQLINYNLKYEADHNNSRRKLERIKTRQEFHTEY